MAHESNTLNPIITGEDDFFVSRGEEMLAPEFSPASSALGIINILREEGVEIVPILICRAVPNGVVSRSFYDKIKSEFYDRTKEALKRGPIDGVCLALHGSMKVEGLGCAEGDFCTGLRELFREHIKIQIVAALDMHATITPLLLEAVDGFVGYKTAPHVDCAETGAKAAGMLLKALNEKQTIRTVSQKIPMLVAGEKSETGAEPMVSLIEQCRKAEEEHGIEAASLLLGFPWADDTHNAVTVLVSYSEDAGTGTNGKNRRKAEKAAHDLASAFWNRRKEFGFRTEFYDTGKALETAYAYAEKGEKSVFVSDSGDNPTAGATGDATDLLEAVMKTLDRADRLPTPLLYSGFFDAPAVAVCIKAGEGAEMDITLGGN
jgi:microcystin degradation protein MlrC